ncbi:MAG: hypothetical protein GF317_24455 [Candidatus Lokiarchaeota archaeon]|nr:hypothetical protein [Candidatus Lokiarchaeota archaeon]MBD3202526.1 hypothetical protein [Candidatus Lokiarchaeota archaeon]
MIEKTQNNKHKVDFFVDLNSKFDIIAPQSKNYIKDTLCLIKNQLGLSSILSIILFGSQASKSRENSCISDCDLLIILKDNVSTSSLKKVEKYFYALEIKHNFREYNSNILKKILFSIQQSTGMFVSHFLTKRKYCVNTKFHKIFNVNRVFSILFAPRKIVLGSVLSNNLTLYGIPLDEVIQNLSYPSIDMFKSLIMNLMISLFSIFILPFKSLHAVKYQLEAVKWSLRASNFYTCKRSKSLEEIIDQFITKKTHMNFKLIKSDDTSFYTQFLNLRKQPKDLLTFMLLAPWKIVKIHIKGFLLKKY